MKKLSKKIVSVLIAVTISASFVENAFAQNSLSWEQDGKRFTINLYTGNLSISCFDSIGNTFTIQEPEYDLELYFSSGHITYYGAAYGANAGKVERVGSTRITYYSSAYGANAGKIENIGSTHITYYSSAYGANAGKVEKIGSARITYYSSAYGAYAGKVENIRGKVR